MELPQGYATRVAEKGALWRATSASCHCPNVDRVPSLLIMDKAKRVDADTEQGVAESDAGHAGKPCFS